MRKRQRSFAKARAGRSGSCWLAALKSSRRRQPASNYLQNGCFAKAECERSERHGAVVGDTISKYRDWETPNTHSIREKRPENVQGLFFAPVCERVDLSASDVCPCTLAGGNPIGHCRGWCLFFAFQSWGCGGAPPAVTSLYHAHHTNLKKS